MVRKAGGVSQTRRETHCVAPFPYTDAWRVRPVAERTNRQQTPMVETRIKPYQEQVAEQARRAEQTRVFRRNQVFGLLMVAAAILALEALPHQSQMDLPARLVAAVSPARVAGASTAGEPARRPASRPHRQRQDRSLARARRAIRRRNRQLRLGRRLSRHGPRHRQANPRRARARCRTT